MQQNGNKSPRKRPSTAIIGEDGVKTHLASWNVCRRCTSRCTSGRCCGREIEI